MTDQKTLKEFLKRRHPEYDEMLPHWNFLEATYHGGREWFSDINIHRFMKEGDQEYQDRLVRAYRFNHTRETTDLVQKYIFKSPIPRNEEDASQEVLDFWKNTTLSGLDINQFMKLASTASSIFGMPWIFTDTTKTTDVQSKLDEKETKARVFAYIVRPQDILDIGYDEHGQPNWVLVLERVRDDENPITSSGQITNQYRLWTRNDWKLFEVKEDSSIPGVDKTVVEEVDSDIHGLNVVPGFPLMHVVGEGRYSAPALINDIAYLDRAVANYLSNLDAIIQDQTFSQLAMPAQNLLPGEEGYEKVAELGTKRIFLFDGEGGGKPMFLSPDPAQAHLIITVINKIINEIYHTIGMAGERTKQDNAVGIDNSSGVAKAYDFERMNSLLTSKADSLENAENKLITLVSLWSGSAQPKEELVAYPDTFDVRTLMDEFSVAEKLSLIDAPDIVRRQQMDQVIDKLFPRLAIDLKSKIAAELAKWPVDPVERATALAQATSPPTNFAASKTKTPAEKRQGQVTKTTK